MEGLYKNIGKRIKLLIDNDDRTVIELAEHLGKKRQAVYNWINATFKPSLEELYKIARYYGVPLEYLIAGKEAPIDDVTAAFLVQTKDLTEQQKKIVFASMKAQVDMFKKMNQDKKKK